MDVSLIVYHVVIRACVRLRQVVDMRWGVPEQAADNHSTTDLCIQEIKKCQEVSVGPNFVVREKSALSICNHSVHQVVILHTGRFSTRA